MTEINNQYLSTILAFGDRSAIQAGATRFLPLMGANDSADELAIIIPRDGLIRQLYWSSETPIKSDLTIAVYVEGVETILQNTWNDVGLTSGSFDKTIKIKSGERVSVKVKLAADAENLTRLRVSFEFVTSGSDFVSEMATPEIIKVEAVEGGDLPEETYIFRVVAEDGQGGTTAGSNEVECTVEGSKRACLVSWTPVPGASRYRIYERQDEMDPEKEMEYFYTNGNETEFTFKSGRGFDKDVVPEKTTAYVNKISAKGPSWILGGKVGIGTDNPKQQLQIEAGTKTNSLYVGSTDFAERSGNGDNIFIREPIRTSGGFWGINVEIENAATHTAQFFPFRYLDRQGNDWIGAHKVLAQIEKSGGAYFADNVAIGITEPQAKLHSHCAKNESGIGLLLTREEGGPLMRFMDQTMEQGQQVAEIHYDEGCLNIQNGENHKIKKIRLSANVIELNSDATPCDYIFEKNYKLMPLNELEEYVNRNHHLPEIPPGDEIEKEGLNISGFCMSLLKQVEELTLHVINQNKKIIDLEEQIIRS